MAITANDVLDCLRRNKCQMTAFGIAWQLNAYDSDTITSRHVATAARSLVNNGQVSINYRNKLGCGIYRYIRAKPGGPKCIYSKLRRR